MKKVMMTKFGFDRWPEEDFSDDGNRFTCYKAGTRVRVSKLVADGMAFIDGSIDGPLPYSIYGKLPHHAAVGELNGIKLDELTEEMLTQLYWDCLTYEKEYDAALQALVYPTESEIRTQCMKVEAKAMEELTLIEEAISGNVVKLAQTLREWDWKTIKEYILNITARIKNYDHRVLPQNMVGKVSSIEFCNPSNSNLKDSYYYTHIMELINK